MGSLTATDPSARAAGSRSSAANHSARSAMRIVRPQPAGLRCRVRLADGRMFTGALPPARHRAIQLGMLHAETAELVELTPGTRSLDGKLALDRRRRTEHYLAGGAAGRRDWLASLLAHAEEIVTGAYATGRAGAGPREEAFVGVAPRTHRRGDKHAIAHSRFLWVDVDEPGELPALWALLAERPCHLLIESGGSGGAHAYWQLAEPLPATRVEPTTGEVTEPIEHANLRLIHALGVDADGRPRVADPACFPAETLVLTDQGHRPIETVRPGDFVLTHMGRWRRVGATMSRRAETVTVTGHGHPGIETTPHHPFLARTREPRWRGGPMAIGAPAWTRAADLNRWCWATPVELEPLPVPRVGGRGMVFTNEFWWLVGRWLGDGSVSPRKPHSSRDGERSALLEICCGHHERDALESRLRMFEPPKDQSFAGCGELRWMTRTKRTVTVFFTGHDGLVAWLVEHFGRGSLGKRLPAFVYGLPTQERRALLDGYISADGSIIDNKRQTSSVSKQLSLGIRQLAETLGHRCGLYCYPQPTDVIEGRKVTTHDQWHVRWTAEPRWASSFVDGRHSWLRVKAVRPAREDVEVFNLTIEEDESYVVEGVVVHNCKERARVMRLAGTVNYKTGQYARVVEADFALPAYPVADLVGSLPDPSPTRRAEPSVRRAAAGEDPYKRIAPPEYFRRLAGITVPRGGLVSCPAPGHRDRHPSCSVGADAGQGWCCHSGECGARGAIYDLASVLLGGPWGRELRGTAFTRARARVREEFGNVS